MDKIFTTLSEWAVPFEYNGEKEIVLNSECEIEGIKYNLKIKKSDCKYGLDLFTDDVLVEILDNSAKEKNILIQIDKYFMNKSDLHL